MLTVEQAFAVLDGRAPDRGGFGSEFVYEQHPEGVVLTLEAEWAPRYVNVVVLLVDVTAERVLYRDEDSHSYGWEETVREADLEYFPALLAERASGL